MTDHADRPQRVEDILSTAFIAAHPRDAALVLEGLPTDEVAAILVTVAPDVGAPVLHVMATLTAADSLAACPSQNGADLLAELPLDVAASLLRRVEPARRAGLLASIEPKTRSSLELLLRYPEGTAGALMEPRILALPQDLSVAQALKHARRQSQFLRYYLYVTDREQRLVGVATLRQLLLASPGDSLSDLASPAERLSVSESRRSILAHPAWGRFHALPVVDSDDILVGVIRYETIRQIDGREEPETAPDLTSLALSLGELYWFGATAVTRLVLERIGAQAEVPQKEEEDA